MSSVKTSVIFGLVWFPVCLFSGLLVGLGALFAYGTDTKIKRENKEQEKRAKERGKNEQKEQADRKRKLAVPMTGHKVEKVRADGGATRAHSGEKRKGTAIPNKEGIDNERAQLPSRKGA